MAKVNLERNTFVRGLITEASPLTFPENASIAEDNFILNRDGSRQRRNGMNYEEDGVLLDTGVSLATHNTTTIVGFRWENVDNNPLLNFGVIQVGHKWWFVDGFQDTGTANVIGSIAINSLVAQQATQFAAIDGKLIAVNAALAEPTLISYTGSGFTEASISIKARDIWGIEESLDVEDRPTDLTAIHEYNLFNQGWPTKLTPYPHFTYKSATAIWPSNADVWHVGKNSSDDFDAALLNKADLGSREAPKGRVLLDIFNRGLSRRNFYDDIATVYALDSSSTIPLDSESSAITTVEAYAGRIFYAGIDSATTDTDDNSPAYSSTIFFTKVVQNTVDLGKCHSTNDPTSGEFNESLATDGGTITIPEASRILRLVNKDTSLIVIAENGVWQITGPDDVFRADDFSISRITNVGATNATSVVVAEGNIFYWSKAGIYQLSGQDATGRLAAQNITETTIQTLFTDIDSIGRTYAVGRYDSDARRISWLYNDTDEYDGVSQRNHYNKELVLDTVLSAFYTITLKETAVDSPYVAGYLPTGAFNIVNNEQAVVVNGEQVVVNGEDVIITKQLRGRGQSSTKYIVIKPNAAGTVTFTLGVFRDVEFLDWKDDDAVGVDADAFLIAGYELFQDSMRKKQLSYLVMHFRATETAYEASGSDFIFDNPSSCLVQSQWDFANHANSGKFGTQIQAYKLSRQFIPAAEGDFDYGKAVITTKNKLRGVGRAFSMRIDTEAGNDLHLYGWALSVEGRSSV
jgi:hypothetical protein